MHAFECGEVRIHHNGDYSGDAIIRLGESETEIPCEALLAFAAEAVRSARIEKAEQASWQELLGVGHVE